MHIQQQQMLLPACPDHLDTEQRARPQLKRTDKRPDQGTVIAAGDLLILEKSGSLGQHVLDHGIPGHFEAGPQRFMPLTDCRKRRLAADRVKRSLHLRGPGDMVGGANRLELLQDVQPLLL
ncbi:hypothetical protein D3C73_1111460 [compost metagenome]